MCRAGNSIRFLDNYRRPSCDEGFFSSTPAMDVERFSFSASSCVTESSLEAPPVRSTQLHDNHLTAG